MKIKQFILNAILTLVGMMAANVAVAQYTAKGTIFDKSSDNVPLPGVTVVVVGTAIGTVSDVHGNFTVTAPSGESILEFRSMGYSTQQIRANFSVPLAIYMEEETAQIEEVVVTALGITRQEKSLGYSVQKVQGETLMQSVSSNWIGNMSGKVAGLTMQTAGTGPGGQTRVILRGNTSLNNANNSALFVVDGVPILFGSQASTGGTNYAAEAAVDFGDNISDINPEDIESVTVLKGPAAAALYGSRAANGAIVITTKRGRIDKGWGVTVNQSVAFEQAMRHPDFQTEYGPSAVTTSLTNMYTSAWGLPGSMTEHGEPIRKQISRYAYGLKFDPNVKRYLYQSKNWETGEFTAVPWVYADDWFTGFFETGVTNTTSVSVQGNSGKGTSGRFNFTNKGLTWVTPNVGYKQQTFAIVLDQEINKHVSLFSNINYVHRSSDNMPMSGYNQTNPMYGLIWGYNAYPISCYRDEYFQGRYTREIYDLGNNQDPFAIQSSLVFNSLEGHNPYRTAYEELNSLLRDRIYGNLGVDFKIIENLNLRVRSGLDLNNDFRTLRKPKLTFAAVDGSYREQSVVEYDINTDFLLTYNKRFGKLSGTAGFGGNDRRWTKRNVTSTAPELDLEGPDMYRLANSAVPVVAGGSRSIKAVRSLYGYLNFDWNDIYFLDFTARNDWSSTLHRDYRSYFYPSIAASVLINKAFNITSHQIDLLKLRLAWSQTGNDTDPYQTMNLYSNTVFPGGFAMSTTLNDPYLKPERQRAYEAGIDVRLFANRLSFDVTVYDSESYDQLISVVLPSETGAQNYFTNGAIIRNRGFEFQLRGIPIRSRDVTWEIFVNGSRNKNVLKEYIPGWDPEQPLVHNAPGGQVGTSIGSRTFLHSYVGEEEMWWIYGADWNRAPEGATYLDDEGNSVDCSGAILINSSTGRPSYSAPNQRIARAMPKWTGGFGTSVRYKSFTMNATFTAQMGGHSFSVTNFALSYQGKLTNSLPGRPDGLVLDGVNPSTQTITPETTYTKNDVITNNIFEYYAADKWVRDNTFENTFSTDFLKLKELRLEYALPAKWMQATRVVQNASIALFATNVFCLSPWPQYDPEAASSTNGSGSRGEIQIFPGIETGVLPMTRTFGFNVKLQF